MQEKLDFEINNYEYGGIEFIDIPEIKLNQVNSLELFYIKKLKKLCQAIDEINRHLFSDTLKKETELPEEFHSAWEKLHKKIIGDI